MGLTVNGAVNRQYLCPIESFIQKILAFEVSCILWRICIGMWISHRQETRPRGLMDKASDFGSEDSRFKSWRGRRLTFVFQFWIHQSRDWYYQFQFAWMILLSVCLSREGGSLLFTRPLGWLAWNFSKTEISVVLTKNKFGCYMPEHWELLWVFKNLKRDWRKLTVATTTKTSLQHIIQY